MMKLMMMGNDCISSSLEAIVMPNAVKINDIITINTKVSGNCTMLSGLNPMSIEIKKMINP